MCFYYPVTGAKSKPIDIAMTSHVVGFKGLGGVGRLGMTATYSDTDGFPLVIEQGLSSPSGTQKITYGHAINIQIPKTLGSSPSKRM